MSENVGKKLIAVSEFEANFRPFLRGEQVKMMRSEIEKGHLPLLAVRSW
jgi:hypothetical protein